MSLLGGIIVNRRNMYSLTQLSLPYKMVNFEDGLFSIESMVLLYECSLIKSRLKYSFSSQSECFKWSPNYDFYVTKKLLQKPTQNHTDKNCVPIMTLLNLSSISVKFQLNFTLRLRFWVPQI